MEESALLEMKKEFRDRSDKGLLRFVCMVEDLVDEFGREGREAILRKQSEP